MKRILPILMAIGFLSLGCEDDGDAVALSSQGGKKRVFISSVTYNGNLGGLSGADDKCNSLASAAGLGGTWKAYLSTAATDAFERIADVGPWYLVDETYLVFQNKAQFSTGPSNPIMMTETGEWLSGFAFVWTGSGGSGDYHITYGACASWTSSSAGVTGVTGNYTENTVAWQTSGYAYCHTSRHIYCFEQ